MNICLEKWVKIGNTLYYEKKTAVMFAARTSVQPVNPQTVLNDPDLT